MNKYIKNGEVKFRNEIVVKIKKTIKDKDGNDKEITLNVLNPSEELLLENGWNLCIAQEPNELVQTLQNKKKEIISYDQSNAVNTFYINDVAVWLDKTTRSGLMLRFQSEKAFGDYHTTLWYNDQEFTLVLDEAIQMLYALEKYASKCYDNTQKHLSEINKLTTIEDINNYDYTIGYPEQLIFSN